MKNNTSIITLAMYVDLLRRSSIGSLTSINDLSKTEQRVYKELVSSGLVSDNKIGAGRIYIAQEIVITPEGANALESWSSYLKQEKLLYKFGDAFIRFL